MDSTEPAASGQRMPWVVVAVLAVLTGLGIAFVMG